MYEAAAAKARAGDAQARAPERFPGAEDHEVGLQEQRRIDPSLTVSTYGGHRIEPAGHDVAYCSVFGEGDPTYVTDCDGHEVEPDD